MKSEHSNVELKENHSGDLVHDCMCPIANSSPFNDAGLPELDATAIRTCSRLPDGLGTPRYLDSFAGRLRSNPHAGSHTKFCNRNPGFFLPALHRSTDHEPARHRD